MTSMPSCPWPCRREARGSSTAQRRRPSTDGVVVASGAGDALRCSHHRARMGRYGTCLRVAGRELPWQRLIGIRSARRWCQWRSGLHRGDRIEPRDDRRDRPRVLHLASDDGFQTRGRRVEGGSSARGPLRPVCGRGPWCAVWLERYGSSSQRSGRSGVGRGVASALESWLCDDSCSRSDPGHETPGIGRRAGLPDAISPSVRAGVDSCHHCLRSGP